MAARPGEENVAILFGDVHYFYGPATETPRHHRFDKGSYVYLFEDASQGRARVEIANSPGTEDQDAFTGYLDGAHLRYSHKQTCVVTLTVGKVDGMDEWHLPTYDPHNHIKYRYKLHSLDAYFWTRADALQFVNGVRRVLPPAQCEILDEPAEPAEPLVQKHPHSDMSPVVQQLERVALADPAGVGASVATRLTPPEDHPQQQQQQQQQHHHHHSHHRRQEQPAVPTADNGLHRASGPTGYASPPLSAAASGTGAMSTSTPPNIPPPSGPPPPPAQQLQQQPFAPIMAYNPAAPAAPEQLRYREKTPPPENGGANPLHQTLAFDAQTPFSPGLIPPHSAVAPLMSPVGPLSPHMSPPPVMHPPPGAPSFPGPPRQPMEQGEAVHQQQQQQQQQTQHLGLTHAATAPAHLIGGSGQASASPSPYTPGTVYSATPGFVPAQQPQLAQQTPGFVSPSPAVGGNMIGAPPGTTAADYAIHQQYHVPESGLAPKKEPRGKLEENAGRLERGVTGILKRFEKKFG